MREYEHHIDGLSPRDFLEIARVKIIALDLDGTTVASGSDDVLNKIGQQVRKLRRRGVKIVVATGRTLFKARQILLELCADKSTPVILFNGAVVVNVEGYDYSINHLPIHALLPLTESVSMQDGCILLYQFIPRDLFGYEPQEKVIGVGPKSKRFKKDFNGLQIEWVDADKVSNFDFNTALILGCSHTPHFEGLNEIDITTSGGEYIEVRPRNVNKGQVLSEIAARRNICREQVLAIGDNDNDYEMLDWAGISIVPDSASAHAKEVATLVSEYGEQDVVVNTLRMVIESMRFSRELERIES